MGNKALNLSRLIWPNKHVKYDGISYFTNIRDICKEKLTQYLRKTNEHSYPAFFTRLKF